MNDEPTKTDLAPLTADDFTAFFKTVNAKSGTKDKAQPFRWQERLVAEVIASGLPSRISLPTATGKTSVLDIFLFALAAIRSGAPREKDARPLPRRFFSCVDRRLIVDQTARHAVLLLQGLGRSDHPTVRRVRHWLSEGRAEPFALLNWRGGLDLPTRWEPDPMAVVICVATVDQVGSRLLFRGYGSSAKHRPVFAAMVGLDSAIVLDEAHLSAPFAQTAQSIVHWQDQCGNGDGIPAPPMQFVQMGATLDPTNNSQPPFELREDSQHPKRDEWQDPLLRPRLIASKRLHVESSDKPLVARIFKDAKAAVGKASKIGIVVSSVRLARDLFQKMGDYLAEASESPKSPRLFLLTGRNRPFVRDALARELDEALANATPESPVILVATQCVEAGYDVSFGYLISDFALIASLIQRLGRLNRCGECTGEAVAKVHHRPKEGTVYGEALTEHWNWVERYWKSDDGTDVSPLALREQFRKHPPPVLRPPHTPMILALHLDVLALTSRPLPAADLDVDTFLHGQDEGIPDVQVVWRADLKTDNLALWPEIIKAVPPRAQEAVSVPISAARRWLADISEQTDELSDTDRNPHYDTEKTSSRIREAVLYQWQGRDEEPDCELIGSAKKLRPGVFIIVPSSYGGCDRFGWAPESQQTVEDIADRLPSRRHRRIRLHPAIRPQLEHAKLTALIGALRLQEQDVELEFDPLATALELLEGVMLAGGITNITWSASAKLALEIHPDGRGVILHVREPSPWADAKQFEVLLDRHQENVSQRLDPWLVGFAKDISDGLRFAALHHDEGKADPRQQADFHGGDTAEAEAWMTGGRLLAKPRVTVPASRKLPQYCRHELASVAIVAEMPELQRLRERDLALSVIGSHHGRGRAIVVPHDDPNPVAIERCGIRISSLHEWLTLRCGWLKMFAALNRRFGVHRLAYVQALLVLADEHQSAVEQEDDE